MSVDQSREVFCCVGSSMIDTVSTCPSADGQAELPKKPQKRRAFCLFLARAPTSVARKEPAITVAPVLTCPRFSLSSQAWEREESAAYEALRQGFFQFRCSLRSYLGFGYVQEFEALEGGQIFQTYIGYFGAR